jgi:predicted ATPase
MRAAAAGAIIGREGEIARVLEWLASRQPLITLLGPGGIGKTRLAKECVLRAGGPWSIFCELAEARSIDDLATTVGAAIGASVRRGSAKAAVRELGEAIASRGGGLMVLDNVEQMVEETAAAVRAWLDAAPSLQIIITSREALQLLEEQRLEVPPLRDGAVELFIGRARRVRPDYDPSNEEREVIAALVDALDGLPLAIELAASRINVLSARSILERLPERFEILKSGARDLPGRHRTLRATLDWSWDLLSDAERSALACTSVFQGPFGLEAAQAVLHDRPAIDLLKSLNDKSLLTTKESASEVRFALLPHIREYARERLTGEERKDAERSRTAVVVAICRRLVKELALERLALERDNLAASIESLIEENGPAEVLAEGLAMLELVSRYRGATSASIALFDRAIGCVRDRLEIVPELLLHRGRLLRSLSLFDEAVRSFSEAHARSVSLGDAKLERDTSQALALMLVEQARFSEARRLLSRALELCSEHDLRPRAEIIGAIGLVHHLSGEPDTALEKYLEAIALHRSIKNEIGLADVLPRMGFLHQDLGLLDAAEQHYREALSIAERTGRAIARARVTGYLGNLSRRRGDWSIAHGFYDDAIGALRRLGEIHFAGVFMMDRGILELLEGDAARAEATLSKALSVIEQVEGERCQTLILAYLGFIAAEDDRIEESESFFHRAEARIAGREEVLFSAVVEKARGAIDLARHRRSGERSELTSARSRLLEPEPAPLEHLHVVQKLLEAAILRADPPKDAILIAKDASSILVGGAPIELSSRESLRGIVRALAEARVRSPGAPLTVEALFLAGWPGQVAIESSRTNRVRVALAELRKLGLASAILTLEGGYLFDPNVPLIEGRAPKDR